MMNKTYIKVSLKDEGRVVDCLQLIKELMANDFVENARVLSGIFPETKKNTKPLTSTQL